MSRAGRQCLDVLRQFPKLTVVTSGSKQGLLGYDPGQDLRRSFATETSPAAPEVDARVRRFVFNQDWV